MKQENDVNRVAILNVLSVIVLQGIAFFSTPIFTRLLGTEQYGIYSVFNSWIAILTCLMGLGMHSSLGTGLYHFKEEYKTFRNSVLLASSLISIAEIVFIAIWGKYISDKLETSQLIVTLIATTAFAHYVVNFAQGAFIYEKRAVENFCLSVLTSLITVTASVILIWNMDRSNRYIGRIYGTAIPYCLIAVGIWIILFREKPTRLNKQYFSFGFKVGTPIIFHSLSQNVLSQSDRVMMQLMGTVPSEIGIYSLFYTLSSVLSVVLSALNNTWCPFYYDDLNEQKWESLSIKCKNYIELFSVLTFGFLLSSREVSFIMADKSYWKGINIIPIIVLAVYFTFMYQFPVNYEFFFKKTNLIAIGTVAAAILNIILNMLLIPKWGIYGAAAATAFSYFALFIAHYYVVMHIKEMPYHLKITAFAPGIASMAIGTIMFYVLNSRWYVRWGIAMFAGGIELYRIYKRKRIF